MITGDEGPLAGITVLDLSSVGPASRATRILADYGANVVKVGAPSGRAADSTSPPYYAYAAQRGMSKVLVDLRRPEGRDAFLALASRADVVVESFRPGTVERLGIGYESVREVNPSVVYCSTTGYGRSGQRAGWTGHDLNYLAVAGYLSMTGRATGGGPPLPGATIADAAGGGMHAAIAVMAALFRRASAGEGAYLEVSVADGVLWLMSLVVDEHLATGDSPAPGHDVLSGRYACYATYEARDHRWLAVAAIEPKFFSNLCRALGCEEWIDKQYEDTAQDQIRAAFASAFASGDRDSWTERLAASDTCVAPVQSIAEVAEDGLFAASGAFVEAKSDQHGAFRQLGALLAGAAPVVEPVQVPDQQATNTDELLRSAGYEQSSISDLRRQGVIE